MPVDADSQWFAEHKDRKAHIRNARAGESEVEFRALGAHDRNRRRVLLWKLPDDAPIGAGKIADVPFLAFADEAIEDTDEVLLPILNRIMRDAQETDMAAHPELYRRQ